MKKLLASLGVAALLATGSLAVAAPAQADDRTCRGTIASKTVDGTIKVPAGATCTLKDVVVKGDVKLGRNATVKTAGGRIEGNLQGESAPKYISVSKTRIEGDVQAKKATGVALRNARVDGNVQSERGTNQLKVIDTRVGGDVQTKYQRLYVTGSTVDGNIQHEEGRKSYIVRNKVGGDIQVFKNKESQTTSRNTVKGNLQCKENSKRPTLGTNGAKNKVSGSKEGQCRTL